MKLKEYREKHEFEAWKISWLVNPHLTNAIKPKDVFDFEKIKEKLEQEEEDELDAFESMFMSKEEKQEKQKKTIADALRRINAKAKAEAEEELKKAKNG